MLDFMLWCRDTLANVVLKQQALPELKIQQKQQEIKMLNVQAYLSSHLQLVLKQISLLLEILPELLQLRTELLRQEIK
ncbi:MAG: hypothetical protein RR944_04315 [Acinetobacter sp.]